MTEILKTSGAIDDGAAERYQAAVGALRADGRHAKALRAFYFELPETEYAAREQAVQLTGWIGSSDDVPMLEGVAMTPLSTVAPVQPGDDAKQPNILDAESELRSAAIAALSRLMQRGNEPALSTLVRLLAKGDHEMATLSGVELADSGKLGAEERRTLAARGVRAKFLKLDFEKTFAVGDPNNGKPAKRPLIVPPSLP